MLSENAISEFVKIANHHLDFIKVHQVEDIEAALRDLQNILTPNEDHFYSERYRDNMSLIAHLMNAPQFYVQNAADIEEFLQIIRGCITAKIQALNSMMVENRYDSPAPIAPMLILQMKERLFAEGCNMSRVEILLFLIHLNIYPPQDILDDSIRHLITENPLPNMSLFSHSYIHPNVVLAINEGIITQEQYINLHPFDQQSLKYLFACEGRQALHQGLVTLEQYLDIPEPARSQAFFDILETFRSRPRMC